MDLPNHNKNITLDLFVIMPDHVHGIIHIVGAGSKPALASNGDNVPKPALASNGDNVPKPALASNGDNVPKPAPVSNDNNVPNKLEPNKRADLERADLESAPTVKNHPLSEIVRQFKTFSTRYINRKKNQQGMPIWQRNYYEHIIRNQGELEQIRQYIINNPDTAP